MVVLAQQVDEEVMMARRVSKNVKCPFYHSQDGSKIKCEGVSHGSTIHLVFPDILARSRYMVKHCNSISACQKCLIHKALYDKWGMDDE